MPQIFDLLQNIFPSSNSSRDQVINRGENFNNRLDLLEESPLEQNKEIAKNSLFDPTSIGIVDRISQLYQPQERATNRLYDMLDQIPNREDYKPSIWRKLGGMVIGGPEGYEFINRPYNEALEEFGTRFGPTQQIANLERSSNQNERIMLDNILQRQLQEQRDKDTARTRDARLQLDLLKFQNPDMKLVNGEDGFVYLVSPQGDKIVNTQLRHGELSELEKMKYGFDQNLTLRAVEQANRERLAGIQSGLRREEEALRHLNDKELENIRITGRYNLARERQTTGTESQSQLKQRYINNANKMMQDQPNMRDWLDFDENGYPIIKTVDEMVQVPGMLSRWFGAKMPTTTDKTKAEDIRKKLVDFIYGQSAQPTSSTTETTRIRVRSSNGQTGWFNGTAEEAQEAGYQVVE